MDSNDKENFNKLLEDAAFTYVYVKEKVKKTSPELKINEEQIGSFQAIKDIVDLLCDAVVEIKEVRDEAISALAAKNMLYNAALEEIYKLKTKN